MRLSKAQLICSSLSSVLTNAKVALHPARDLHSGFSPPCSCLDDLSPPCKSLMIFKRFLKYILSSFYYLSSAGGCPVTERFLSPLFSLEKRNSSICVLDCMYILRYIKGASLFQWSVLFMKLDRNRLYTKTVLEHYILGQTSLLKFWEVYIKNLKWYY